MVLLNEAVAGLVNAHLEVKAGGIACRGAQQNAEQVRDAGDVDDEYGQER
ncbi:hypothetical protein [Streptomyces sp. NPDC001594]